jgi:error-prone DNA polymerase
MGFYGPATLVKDAQRHGVEVRPIDVAHSSWKCTLEDREDRSLSVRLGLRYAAGLRQETGLAIEAERRRAPFASIADLARRVALRRDELDTLAELGALASIDPAARTRRSAVWQVAAVERDRGSLFAGVSPAAARARLGPASPPCEPLRGPVRPTPVAFGLGHLRLAARPSALPGSPLTELSPLETTLADYRLSGLTTGPQIMEHLRAQLCERGVLTAAELHAVPDGRFVRTAGHAIVRQRPGTAKGFCFLTLEDETGTANAILTPKQFRRFRVPLHSASIIEIAGPLQNADDVIHVRVRELRPLVPREALPRSHDYR